MSVVVPRLWAVIARRRQERRARLVRHYMDTLAGSSACPCSGTAGTARSGAGFLTVGGGSDGG